MVCSKNKGGGASAPSSLEKNIPLPLLFNLLKKKKEKRKEKKEKKTSIQLKNKYLSTFTFNKI